MATTRTARRHTSDGWKATARAPPTFPVFYPDRLPEMLAVLDFPGIRQIAAAIPKKRDRLAWALTHHGYLPNDFLALLTGCSENGVKKARARLAPLGCRK